MHRRNAAGLAAIIIVAVSQGDAQAAPRLLDPMFTDHAVLQRGRPIAIWGEAAAGTAVSVALGGSRASATAGADGRWRVQLPTMKAGGPHVLSATAGGERQSATDILVGDVFLCSGQSNMEWSVAQSSGGAQAVAASADPRLRMLTIPQLSQAAALPRLPRPADWKVAGPDTTGDFSGVCYFMAETLRRRSDVPIGLIDASWGGSAIAAWQSRAAFLASGGDPAEAALLEPFATDPDRANLEWGRRWTDWYAQINSDPAIATPWAEDYRPGPGWKAAPTLERPWETWGDPALADYNGMVWYRGGVTLTAAQAAQRATLLLGRVDEVDQTFVNGRPVGNGSGTAMPRAYALPAGLLRAGVNRITVNVLDTWAQGGLFGPDADRAIELADGTRVPFDRDWSYHPVASTKARPPRAPWDAIGGIGTLYNGMIAPLSAYDVAGVVWYQGESNTKDGMGYAPKLRALIDDYRTWQQRPVPVVVIQLPNWGKVVEGPQESEWAVTREAQRRALASDPDSALVVTIDVGDPADLHPTNKRPVGMRAAWAFEALTRRSAKRATGPLPVAATRGGERIRVTFAGGDGPLRSRGPVGPFQLCGDAPGSCRAVAGTLSGRAVTLASARPTDRRVRYCWADSPTCSLTDDALPATPFELPIQ